MIQRKEKEKKNHIDVSYLCNNLMQPHTNLPCLCSFPVVISQTETLSAYLLISTNLYACHQNEFYGVK